MTRKQRETIEATEQDEADARYLAETMAYNASKRRKRTA